MDFRALTCLWCLLCLQATTGVLSGQSLEKAPPQLTFEHLSVEDGLASPLVRSVIQDRQGFLWIGTFEGLDVYDGYSFTPYPFNLTDSLNPQVNNIGELYEDHQGMIWAGSREGLLKIDPRTRRVTPFVHDPNDPASLSHNNVFELVETEPGTLWIGTERGVNRLDIATGAITRYERDTLRSNTLPSNLITALAVDARGTLWVGTEEGLCRYEAATDGFSCFGDAEALPSGLPHRFIRTLAADSTQTLWIGTAHGLSALDLDTMRFTRVATPFDDKPLENWQTIIALHLDDGGILWVGSDGGGLAALDPATGTWTQPNLPYPGRSDASRSVRTIIEDQTGIIWVGLWDGGLYKGIPQIPFTTYTYTPDAPGRSLTDPVVTSIHPSARTETIWIGTKNGLNALDPKTGTIEHYQNDPNDPSSLSHNEIWGLEVADDGTLWVATMGGLNQVDPVSKTFRHFRYQPDRPESISSDHFQAILQDRTGTFWIGTPDAGLNRLTWPEGQITTFVSDSTAMTPSHYSIWPLLESRHDSSLWIGTMGGGLNRYDPDTGRFTVYRHDLRDSTSISSDYIISLYEDRTRDLWIGTQAGGLSRYVPAEDRFYRYTTEDGLPHNTVTCIAGGRRDERWISTSRGLARLDLQTQEITRFGTRDGLPDNAFHANACYTMPDGRLYFGLKSGLVAFDPEAIQPDRHSPPVVLTGLDLFNEPLALDSSVTYEQQVDLDYDENTLTFHFSALHHAAPEEQTYAYKLEGVDQVWQSAGSQQRSVTYAHLGPGRYVFRVKAANPNGVWNEQGAALRLAIAPPFWQTWWFVLLVLLAVGGMIWTGIRLRIRYVIGLERARHQLENERQQSRLRVAQTRERIAHNLHDDIGSDLTGIGYTLDVMALSVSEPSLKDQVQGTARQIYRVVRDLRDTVWAIEAQDGHLVGLVKRLDHACAELLRGTDYDMEYPDDLPETPIEGEIINHILFAFKEILHNIHRHAEARHVRVTIDYTPPMLVIDVRDDGKGFRLREGTGQGLRSMQMRAEHVGGSVEIETEPGQGTQVRFTARIA